MMRVRCPAEIIGAVCVVPIRVRATFGGVLHTTTTTWHFLEHSVRGRERLKIAEEGSVVSFNVQFDFVQT